MDDPGRRGQYKDKARPMYVEFLFASKQEPTLFIYML